MLRCEICITRSETFQISPLAAAVSQPLMPGPQHFDNNNGMGHDDCRSGLALPHPALSESPSTAVAPSIP